MNKKDVTEKELKPMNGIGMLILSIILVLSLPLGILMLVMNQNTLSITVFTLSIILSCIVAPILWAGLKSVQPNEARVLTLFGSYHGTISHPGFYFVNPFCVSYSPESTKLSVTPTGEAVVTPNQKLTRCISLKTQTLNNNKQKVNDLLGNPIIIGAIVLWRVDNPTQAVFSVENYKVYLETQTDSIIRNVSRLYPYDIFDEDDDAADNVEGTDKQEKTLRGSALEIAELMKAELQKRVHDAGLIIEDVRITHLAYAEEIAAAMLQRQQAAAIIAARQKIVDGAVGMVKMAIDKLGEEEVVILDEERKAAMVSNLLVVLCGSHDAQPIVNSGSIY
ncbi:MAG: SPFH domain-containing protein [Streptococcaceae bacterium]|jgi:regulator of protease activity HflC (stomatin/prohibitin superfamily)|nr:SPFH domain-containing protein [Streptococcaceae bacterium]